MGELDLGLYLGSALLTAGGLTLIKLDLSAARGIGIELIGWALLVRLAGAAAAYFSGMGLWLIAMARNPLSTAYPIGIGLSLASATLAAAWALGEPVGWFRVAGIALILGGAMCVSRSRA